MLGLGARRRSRHYRSRRGLGSGDRGRGRRLSLAPFPGASDSREGSGPGDVAQFPGHVAGAGDGFSGSGSAAGRRRPGRRWASRQIRRCGGGGLDYGSHRGGWFGFMPCACQEGASQAPATTSKTIWTGFMARPPLCPNGRIPVRFRYGSPSQVK